MLGNMLQEFDRFHIIIIGPRRLTWVWGWKAATALSTSNLSLCGEAVMIAPHYQHDWVWNHLGTHHWPCLEEYFQRGEKSYLEYGWHCPRGWGPGLNWKKREQNTSIQSSVSPYTLAMWPAASHCHHTFSAVTDCPFLPGVASVIFGHRTNTWYKMLKTIRD